MLFWLALTLTTVRGFPCSASECALGAYLAGCCGSKPEVQYLFGGDYHLLKSTELAILQAFWVFTWCWSDCHEAHVRILLLGPKLHIL